MSFFSTSELDSVRSNPSQINNLYTNKRGAFLSAPGVGPSGWWNGWSENQIKLGFCSVFAYENSSYGTEPNSWVLTDLLAAPTLACDRYVTLTWLLYEEMGTGDTDQQAAIGVNGGYAGNHAQLLSFGTTPILIDPTIGFMVSGVSFDSLFKGIAVPINNFVSFYYRTELSAFKQTISEALYYGYYKPSDLLYYVPKLSNWNAVNISKFTTPQKWVVQP